MRVIAESDCPDCHGKGEVLYTEDNHEGCWMMSYTCPCVRYEHSARDLEILKSVLQQSAE